MQSEYTFHSISSSVNQPINLYPSCGTGSSGNSNKLPLSRVSW